MQHRHQARRLEPWALLLVATSLIAWSILALGTHPAKDSVFCSPAAATPNQVAEPTRPMILTREGNFTARMALDSALMITAMMLPLLIVPLRHVHDRNFARLRARTMLLFIVGYATVWIPAGIGLQSLVLAARWAVPSSAVCFGFAAVTALIWQASPAKQWSLNRCHRQPQLRAFGTASDRDALCFGFTHAVYCFAACWALMFSSLLLTHHHLEGMLAVALFVAAERLERPAPLLWRWRGPAKALRIAAAQVVIRVAAL